jgi:primosomal protein N' (replication factor Y)
MYHTQINQRRIFRYPPFYRLITLSLKHKDHVVVNKAAKEMATLMRSSFGTRVLGPESPVINRIQTYYLKNIILKVERERSFQRAKEILKDIIDQVVIQDNYKSLQVVADVDPM